MRKSILVLILILIFTEVSGAGQYFGIFGTGTETDDTCRICFPTFDTLGHSADAAGDSVYFLRFVRGTLIDSTYGGTKTRNYLYCIFKKAYDGSNLGQYAVVFFWRPVKGKWYNDDGYYIVQPETVSYSRGDTIQRDASTFNHLSDNVIVGVNNDKQGYSLSSSGVDAIWDEDTTGHNASGSYGEVLESRGTSDLSASDNIGINWSDVENENASHYFNQTSFLAVDSVRTEGDGLDPDSVANHVWIWPDRTLTSGSGGGVHQVSIFTKQSSDSAEISGASVQILNLTQASTLGFLSTNASGKAVFALDSDTFLVRMSKPGWIFNVPETLIVTGNTDTIYYADIFNPGSPPSAELCRVYGWVKDIQNLALSEVKIEASIQTIPLKYQGVIISPYFRSTSTDSEGYWNLDLYPNSVLFPDTTQYEFLIYSTKGTILRLKATVPDQSSWELSF